MPRTTRLTTARTALRLHAASLGFAAALYLGDLRYVVAGGGTPTHSLIDAYGMRLAWAIGTLQSPAIELLACVVVVAGLAVTLRRTCNTTPDEWAFFVGVIVVFPIALIIVRGSALVYTRHFLVGTTFVLLLQSRPLGDWWRHGRSGRIGTAVVLVCYAMLNGYHVVDLARHGRGQYLDAIRYIADHTAGPLATIGADQDFRVGTELESYLADVDAAKPLRSFEHGSWPADGSEWLIAQAESFETLPPPENVGDAAGHEFSLAATFPTAPLSRLHWFVYHDRASK